MWVMRKEDAQPSRRAAMKEDSMASDKKRTGSKLRVVAGQALARRKRRGITKDKTLMQKVVLAKFPPSGDPPCRSDREVAAIVGINVEAVNGLVRAAFEHGLVSAQHHSDFEVIERARLEDEVRLRYKLQRVILVPGLPEMLEDLSVMQRRSVQTHVIRDMASSVVQYLDTLLSDAARTREQFTLGVAWGRTMRLVVERLRSTLREVHFPELEVVPIVGSTCELLREPTEANVIAMRVAEAYDGQASQLACPAFVRQDDVWVVTQRLEQVRRMLKKLATCDAVLTSMGPIPDDDNAADEITLCSDPNLNGELFRSARTWKAIGEICYWLFDDQGTEVKTNHTAIGLGFAGLQKIAADPSRQVILVAGGDRRRFEPLRAALRAKLASVLVSDTITARFLVGEG
jgi:DNA-binding transcriptional regulator LsrR (DeoR family)